MLSHRNTDLRTCGAGTVVAGQDFVRVNGQLWAVQGDPNDHGDGALIAAGATWITISGKPVIVVTDPASPDGLCPTAGGPHCSPAAATGDGINVG